MPTTNIEEDRNISIADTVVLVEQGELLMGILDKNTLGASNGSMIHIIQVSHCQVCNRLIVLTLAAE